MKTQWKLNRPTAVPPVKLPKDAIWQIFGELVTDLGIGASIDHPNYQPDFFGVHKIVRARDREALAALQSELTPLRIGELFGKSEANFFAYYQLSSFLKKYRFPGDVKLRKLNALAKFNMGEQLCKLYNDENHKALIALSENHPNYLGILDELRRDILGLLGERPDLACIYGHARHGPGVAIGSHYQGGKVTSYYKWSSLPYSVTRRARSYAIEAISSDPRWLGALDDWYRRKFNVPVHSPIDPEKFWDSVLLVSEASKITTVPKSFDTDRTIAIEPVLNVYLQLGVDYIMRRRLIQRWGYDINNQQANRDLAESASIEDDAATVDLSMASELVSLKICELLLPAEWYGFLTDLRCYAGTYKDPLTSMEHAVTFEKMSSMGNGFTFALETVVFGALVRCAIRRSHGKRVSAVYGDDIILPKNAYPMLVELLDLCGFKVNHDKTFVSGPFRESCGADFYRGTNVRPVFLKKPLKSLQDVLYLHNSLFKLAEEKPWYWGFNYQRTLSLLFKWIPVPFRRQFYGPSSETMDCYVFSDRKTQKNGYGESVVWQLVPKAREFNGKTDFFFRKLMVTLGDKPPNEPWLYEKGRSVPGRGSNAFDVTRRNAIEYYTRERRILRHPPELSRPCLCLVNH